MSGTTSYTVNARLQITGNVDQALRTASRSLGNFSRTLVRTERNLNSLIGRLAHAGVVGAASMRNIAAAAAPLRQTMIGIGGAVSSTGRQFAQMGPIAATGVRGANQAMTSLRTSIGGVSVSLGQATNQLGRQAAALTQNATAASRLGQAATNATNAMRALAAATPPRLSVRTGGASGGGGVGAAGTGRGHDRLSELAGASIIANRSGAMLGATMEAAGERQQALTMVRARQRTPEEVELMTQEARRLPGVIPGTNTAVALTVISDLMATIPDVRQAIGAAEPMLRAATVASIQTGKPIDQMADLLTRIMALRGAWVDDEGRPTPERGLREVNMAIGAMLAMGSRFNPTEMLNTMQQAGPMGRSMSAESLWGLLPSLISETRGFRAGTAMAAFNRQFLGGVMPKRVLTAMQEAGLIARNTAETAVSPEQVADLRRQGMVGDDESADELLRSGLVKIDPRAIRGLTLARDNPLMYFEQFIRKSLTDRGITEPAAQERELNQIASTDVLRRLFVQFQQMPEFMIDFANTQRVWAAGQAPTNTVLHEGWNAAMMNLSAGLRELQGGIGEGTAGDLIPRMHQLSAALRGLGDWARENPETTTVILTLTAALGGLALAGATFAAGSLAVGGLTAMATGIVALGAAITPVGWALILAGLVGGLVSLATTLSSEDWSALFGRATSGLQTLWQGARNFFGFGPNGGGAANPSELGFEPGSGMPSLVPPPNTPWSPLPNPIPPVPGMGTGGTMEDLISPLPGPPPATPAPPRAGNRSSFEPMPTRERPVNLSTNVYLDGRQIAEVVSTHQGRMASGASTGVNRFDWRRGIGPAEGLYGTT